MEYVFRHMRLLYCLSFSLLRGTVVEEYAGHPGGCNAVGTWLCVVVQMRADLKLFAIQRLLSGPPYHPLSNWLIAQMFISTQFDYLLHVNTCWL